jgi:hypothetical protein
MGRKLGQSIYMGRQSRQPPYMGGLYMGGPYRFSISPQPRYGPNSIPIPYDYHQYPYANGQIPFLDMLDLPDLSHLTNDPIQHTPFWLAIPSKFPSNILKFKEKPREYPNNHVMTFHLWCSSNSLMDDSILLKLFERTLTGAATKLYIEILRNSFVNFNYLSMVFMTHFQLSIWYDTSTEHFTSLLTQNHIHE